MKSTIYKKIRKNYIILYLLTFIITMAAILFVLTMGKSVSTYKEDNYAKSLMKQNYKEINTDFVTDHGGTSFVVDNDLNVIPLCGNDLPELNKFTMEEWTRYINKMDVQNKDYVCDIYYNEESKYWLVVKMPVALNCSLVFNINTSKKVLPEALFIVFVLLIICLLINFIYIAIYSKFTSKYFIKPLNMFENMIRQLEKGNYKDRLKVKEDNEFGKVAESFNRLADSLNEERKLRKQSEDNRKRLILDISHDLKNPLTSTIGSLELVFKENNIKNEQLLKHYIKMAYDNSLRADVLINELFEYSKLDSPDYKLKLEKTDICEYMRIQIASEIDAIEAAHFKSVFDIPENSVYAMIDSVHFGRVIHNLISNTIKYNSENTKIYIGVMEEDKNIRIIIKDDGIGIDKKLNEDIFDVFVRDNNKTKTNGTGLGLTIAKKIVTLHNGTITLDSDINKGCIFTIIIPKL